MVNWLEVEVKVKVEDMGSLRKKVKKIADFERRDVREDDYFARGRHFRPIKTFRIRNDGKKLVVNFKKPVKNLWKDGIVVKREFEFELNDRKHIDNFLALVEDFGFKEWIKKRKHTERFLLRRDRRVVIELSKVEHIGDYMEIEYLAQPEEVERARKLIKSVLVELGVRARAIDNVSYTRRLYEKGIMGKKNFIGKLN